MTASKQNRFGSWATGLAGVALLLVILIAVNWLAGDIRLRWDMTKEKLYTLSDGTVSILDELEQPVLVRMYYSRSLPDAPIAIKTFAGRVEDLLREIELKSDGKIDFKTVDPKPDTDDEDLAVELGVTGQRFDLTSPPVYLGLVATCGAEQRVIPFLHQSDEPLLEYHLMRMVHAVANPDRPVIGVMSSLPVLGLQPPPFAMPGQPQPRPQPAWYVFSELRRDFDVREVDTTATEIPAEISALVIVHPKQLGDETLYAIDQFLLRGGRILAFVDPMCTADSSASQGQFGPPQASSNMEKLFSAWGLRFNQNEMTVDTDAITPLFRNHPAGMLLKSDVNINREDTLVAQMESLLLLFAGTFSGEPVDGLTLTPILRTSPQSGTVSAYVGQMGMDAVQRELEIGNQSLNLAVRLRGTFPSAFPEGRPEGEASDAAGTGPILEHVEKSVEEGAVILVGDVDLLIDQHVVQTFNTPFGQARQPFNDNGTFLWTSVEQLSGATALMGLRTRGSTDREFTRVRALREKAQREWLAEAKRLRERESEIQQKLNDLEQNKDEQSQRLVLSKEQEELIERYRKEAADNAHQRREVEKNLRKGIDRLGAWVKWTSILTMPMLVCLAGMGFHFYRRSKTRN